ncbi:hypothetical protein Tco_0036821, partial [Tanacetum coccineum]
LESFERQDWTSCVWGTSQDAMTSHVVTAVFVVWYLNLVKPSLAMLCVHLLLKLVMAMNDKYNSTAVEILAEDTFMEIRVSLVELILPSLAMADVPAFLHVIERQL